MRTFNNSRKIPTLVQFIFLLTLVFLVLTLLLISVANNSAQGNNVDRYQEISLENVKSELGLSLSSACLSRDILNSGEVQLYSNRLPSKQYYLTIGIPTIARKIGNQYLMTTLNSLSSNQSVGNSKPDLLIVVQLGDQDKEIRLKLSAKIKGRYSNLISDGVLDIIQVYPSFYPSFDNLKQRFGDSKTRVKWRSKQVIDFSFLSCYCSGLGKYHLQLEDDVIASPYYYLKIKNFIQNYEAKEKWFTLDVSVLGYIGKVYHNYDLNEIASFYYIFFDEMPVDWLEYTWRDIKGQTGRWRFRSASLFQHIGLVSSLTNKKQLAKEPYFDNQSHKFLGLNPPAKISTDIKGEHKTSIKSVYERGDGYFWGKCQAKSKCYVNVVFEKAIPVSRIIVETGGNFAINDTIHAGSLKVGTYLNVNDCVHYEIMHSANFKRGHLDFVFPKKKAVHCLRISIKQQQEWVFIREINVWAAT